MRNSRNGIIRLNLKYSCDERPASDKCHKSLCWLVAGWLLTRDTWVAADVGLLATAQPGAATNGGHQPRLSPGHQRVTY